MYKQVIKLLDLKKGNSFEKKFQYEEGEKFTLKAHIELDNPNGSNSDRIEIINVIITNINPPFKINKAEVIEEEMKQIRRESVQK